jgi:hypothetical protein
MYLENFANFYTNYNVATILQASCYQHWTGQLQAAHSTANMIIWHTGTLHSYKRFPSDGKVRQKQNINNFTL